MFFEEGGKLENPEKNPRSKTKIRTDKFNPHMAEFVVASTSVCRLTNKPYFISGVTHYLVWLQAELKHITERLPAILQPTVSEYSSTSLT